MVEKNDVFNAIVEIFPEDPKTEFQEGEMAGNTFFARLKLLEKKGYRLVKVKE